MGELFAFTIGKILFEWDNLLLQATENEFVQLFNVGFIEIFHFKVINDVAGRLNRDFHMIAKWSEKEGMVATPPIGIRDEFDRNLSINDPPSALR